MKLLRWMAVSFSIYSQIPMPHFEWSDEDYGHSLVFFPMVGAVIGALIYAAYRLCLYPGIPEFVTGIVFVLIPILVTGGFHLDGYMDTMDARRSYGSVEKKLEILKDPHIGAFAVICLISTVLIFVGAAGVIVHSGSVKAVLSFCILFVLSRALSGLLAVTAKPAKSDGMLIAEISGRRGGLLFSLWLWIIISLLALGFLGIIYASAIAVTLIAVSLYYRHMIIREFGGATGDTAGYYLTMCEVLGSVSIAAVTLFIS
ncbi:MAG: adenosylcobinamide-GDP ribazoletransferase [Lachnospiraceae bacterium]|nr:adenosylcobinamide-GDP ribazoletransferase [Lachnospiraceae bacterium]